VTTPDLCFETYARMACWRLPRKGNLSRIRLGIAIDGFRNLSRETAVSRDELYIYIYTPFEASFLARPMVLSTVGRGPYLAGVRPVGLVGPFGPSVRPPARPCEDTVYWAPRLQ